MNKKQEKSMTLKVDKDKLIFEFNKKIGKHLKSAAKEANKEQREVMRKKDRQSIIEIEKKVKRIKLDMDVVECDCGRPYKDSDPADLINELLKEIKSLK